MTDMAPLKKSLYVYSISISIELSEKYQSVVPAVVNVLHNILHVT